MRRSLLTTFIIIAALSGSVLIASSHTANRPTLTLDPGDVQPIVCADGSVPLNHLHTNRRDVFCATAVATATPEPTATTPAPTPTHDHGSETMLRWHPPGAHDGLPAHEHGDAPPQWVLDAGYDPTYTHAANTVGENDADHAAVKHTGFKGFAGTMNGVQVYVIQHLDTTPSGHTSRFHSYQVWLRDSSGGVTHLHGWFDYGDGANVGPNIRRNGCESTTIRPIMAVRDEPCNNSSFESWYSGPGRAWVDTGFNVKPQYFTGGDPLNPATWNPTGNANDVRRIELAFYTAGKPTGTFWSDQFRRPLIGPDDPLVGTTVTVGSRSYTVVALEQYIAPTRQQISFPGNSFQRVYEVPQPFSLPN